MKKHFGAGITLALLLFCSCDTMLTEDGGLAGFDADYLAALEEQTIFSEPGLVVGTDLVKPGAVVTTISFPPEDGPWTAALVKGEGDTHNRLFKIVHIDEDGTETDDGEGEGEETPVGARLVIKEDAGTLEWGRYSARIRIGNEAGVAFRRILEFDATLTPPFFKKAPGIYPVSVKSDGSTYPTLDMQYATGNIPDITKGKHKLVIKWDKRATATSYKVYVGTMSTTIDVTKDPTVAPNIPTERVLLGTYGGDAVSAELTGYPSGTDGLPDNTRYWVWVSAANASGETPLSPVGTKKTSAPVQPYFYENKNDSGVKQSVANYHDCGGYGDYYRFTPTTAKYWFGTAGGYNYLGDILYHETIDLGPNGENGAFLDKIKDNASCLGFPAGVFVIKYREDRVPPSLSNLDKGKTVDKQRRYSAVYYWGTGTIKPENKALAGKAGRVESDIVNQWGGSGKYGGYAETVTYEEAIDLFTAENIVHFLGLDPEPYYKEFRSGLTGPDYHYGQAPSYEPWSGEGVYTADLE